MQSHKDGDLSAYVEVAQAWDAPSNTISTKPEDCKLEVRHREGHSTTRTFSPGPVLV